MTTRGQEDSGVHIPSGKGSYIDRCEKAREKIWQLRILFGTKRASNRVIKCLICPVNLKNSIIFVPIEVDNYDDTGRNIAVPAL